MSSLDAVEALEDDEHHEYQDRNGLQSRNRGIIGRGRNGGEGGVDGTDERTAHHEHQHDDKNRLDIAHLALLNTSLPSFA